MTRSVQIKSKHAVDGGQGLLFITSGRKNARFGYVWARLYKNLRNTNCRRRRRRRVSLPRKLRPAFHAIKRRRRETALETRVSHYAPSIRCNYDNLRVRFKSIIRNRKRKKKKIINKKTIYRYFQQIKHRLFYV